MTPKNNLPKNNFEDPTQKRTSSYHFKNDLSHCKNDLSHDNNDLRANLLLEVKGLHKTFVHVKRNSKKNSQKKFNEKTRKVLNDVSLQVYSGEYLGIIGESGSGKSTLLRCISGLLSIDSGSIDWFDHEEVKSLAKNKNKTEMIFQDPLESLNPRYSVSASLEEGRLIQKKGITSEEMIEALKQVDLPSEILSRFPLQLSGGQRQRISIARALLLNPKILLCDEPVSALDALTQDSVLKTLKLLNQNQKLTLVMVSHHLEQVLHYCDRVIVLLGGKIMEEGPAQEVLVRPRHPYTKSLLESKPQPKWTIGKEGQYGQNGQYGDEGLARFSAKVAVVAEAAETLNNSDFNDQIRGCPFVDRCQKASSKCRDTIPEYRKFDEKTSGACFYPL